MDEGALGHRLPWHSRAVLAGGRDIPKVAEKKRIIEKQASRYVLSYRTAGWLGLCLITEASTFLFVKWG